MASIRKKDTEPELLLRQSLTALGMRGYRLYRALPGRPDITFGPARVAVFVDGCFWHRCPTCKIPVPPAPYWQHKLRRNSARDRENDDRLALLGWSVVHIWEHEIREDPRATARLVRREVRKRSRTSPS